MITMTPLRNYVLLRIEYKKNVSSKLVLLNKDKKDEYAYDMTAIIKEVGENVKSPIKKGDTIILTRYASPVIIKEDEESTENLIINYGLVPEEDIICVI